MPSAAPRPVRGSSHSPAAWMLAASGTEALIPLAVVVCVGSSDVLVFGALISVGLALGSAGLLATGYRSALCWGYVRSRVFWRRHVWQRHFGLSLLGRFEYPLFVVAAAQIGVARTSVIWGICPMVYVMLLYRSTRPADGGPGRYRRLTLRDLVIVGVALTGLTFTVSSQPAAAADAGSSWGVLVGFGVAAAAALCAALNSYNLTWGIELAASAATQPRGLCGGAAGLYRREAAHAMLGVFLAAAGTAPVVFMLAAVVGRGEASAGSIWGALLIGVCLLTPPVMFIRIANLRTHNLGVNAISYLTPVFSIAALAVFGRLGDIRVGHLVVGVAAITAANLMLNINRS